MIQSHPGARRAVARNLSLALAAGIALLAPAAQAQEYPSKPIRLILPFPAGTGVDANAREIAAKM